MGRRTAIGLDVGTSCVRAAELSLKASGPELVRFGQIALPEGALRDGEVVAAAAVTAAIADMWKSVGFSHRKVTVGIANPRVIVRQVEVPVMPASDLRKALPLLVGDQVPIDANEAVMDFAPLEEIRGSDGSRALSGLLVAGVEEMIVRTVDSVIAAGLTPLAVDLSAFAVLRSVVTAPGLGLGVHPEAVIDVGADLTDIIVHENGIPRFVRILLIGGSTVSQALMSDLNVSLSEAEGIKREIGLDGPDGRAGIEAVAARSIGSSASALVEEIRGSLDYFAATSPSGPVTRIVLAGGGAQLRGLAEHLEDRLRLPVHHASPLSGLQVGRTGLSPAQLAFVDPICAVPVGLALGQAS